MDAAAVGCADGDRAGEGVVGAVAHPRGLAHDLVEGRHDEVRELDLGDRPQAVDGGADRGTHDHRLGQRRVQHAVAAELVVEAVRGQEDATLLAHVLAQDDHRRVAAHLRLRASRRIASMKVMTAMRQPSPPDSGPPSPMNRAVPHSGSSMRAGGESGVDKPLGGGRIRVGLRRRRSRWRPRPSALMSVAMRSSAASSSTPASRSCSRKCGSGSRRALLRARRRCGTSSAGRPTSAPSGAMTLASRASAPRRDERGRSPPCASAVAAQHVDAVEDHAGHGVPGGPHGDVLAPPTRGAIGTLMA